MEQAASLEKTLEHLPGRRGLLRAVEGSISAVNVDNFMKRRLMHQKGVRENEISSELDGSYLEGISSSERK